MTKNRRGSRIHRNHGVELLLKPADAYLAYAGWRAIGWSAITTTTSPS